MTTSVDMWRPYSVDQYGQHHRDEIWAFQMYPDSRPDYFVPADPTGGRHAERVRCVEDCGAPADPDDYPGFKAAYVHWRYHLASWAGLCSHDDPYD